MKLLSHILLDPLNHVQKKEFIKMQYGRPHGVQQVADSPGFEEEPVILRGAVCIEIFKLIPTVGGQGRPKD